MTVSGKFARSSLALILLAACATAGARSEGAGWIARSELGHWNGEGTPRVHDSGMIELRWKAMRPCREYLLTMSSETARPSVVYDSAPGTCGVLIGVARRPEAREFDLSSSQIEVKIDSTMKVIFEVVAREYEKEALTGIPPKFIEPPKKMLPRIRAEAAEIGRLYQGSTQGPRLWDGMFRNPVETTLGADARVDCTSLKQEIPGCIKSRFGKVRTYNGVPKNPHPGTDLKAPLGQPLVAPEKGKVVLARNLYFTGNTVILDHGAGVVTIYAHLSKLAVKKGAVVTKGTRLGLSGATGRAVGAHLHWGAVIDRLKVEPLDLMGVPSGATP